MAATTSENPQTAPISPKLFAGIVIFALVLLSGIYITNEVLPKVYSATAEIQIKPAGVVAIPGFLNVPKQNPDPPFQAEMEIIESRDILQPVISDLNLDKIWAKRIGKSGQDQLSQADAIAYLQKRLCVEVLRGTDIIKITASSEVPKEAADIANAIASRYKKMRDDDQMVRGQHGLEVFQDQIDQQQKVVEEKKAIVEKLRQELGRQGMTMDPDTGPDAGNSDLVARKKDLLSAQEDYDARKVLLQKIQTMSDDELMSTLTASGRDNEQSEYSEKRVAINKLLKAGVEETDPRIVALRQQCKDLANSFRHSIQVDTDLAKSRVDLLQKEVDSLEAKRQENTNLQLKPFRDAQRELEEQQSILDALTIRLKQVNMDLPLQESPVRIISRAEVPTVPTKPNKPLCYAVTFLAALFLGVLGASPRRKYFR